MEQILKLIDELLDEVVAFRETLSGFQEAKWTEFYDLNELIGDLLEMKESVNQMLLQMKTSETKILVEAED